MKLDLTGSFQGKFSGKLLKYYELFTYAFYQQTFNFEKSFVLVSVTYLIKKLLNKSFGYNPLGFDREK